MFILSNHCQVPAADVSISLYDRLKSKPVPKVPARDYRGKSRVIITGSTRHTSVDHTVAGRYGIISLLQTAHRWKKSHGSFSATHAQPSSLAVRSDKVSVCLTPDFPLGESGLSPNQGDWGFKFLDLADLLFSRFVCLFICLSFSVFSHSMVRFRKQNCLVRLRNWLCYV